MTKIMKGVLYDKRIELEQEPDLPPGTVVTIRIEPQELSVAGRRRLVRKSGGTWHSDMTIGPIFERILQERSSYRGREVNFGDTA